MFWIVYKNPITNNAMEIIVKKELCQTSNIMHTKS